MLNKIAYLQNVVDIYFNKKELTQKYEILIYMLNAFSKGY